MEALSVNMQSYFRLPWCNDPIARKFSDAAALDKMRATPLVEIPVLNNFKRKRTDSSDAASYHQLQASKKQRPEAPAAPSVNSRVPVKSEAEQTFTGALTGLEASSLHQAPNQNTRPCITSITSTYSTDNPSANVEQPPKMSSPRDTVVGDAEEVATKDALGLTPLQQVIENEFNMAILMKHNELRLIEQELAKCQIALEQLRRCEILPFPGADGLSQDVSSGTGPAIAPPPGVNRPAYAAAHGTTNGPYTRHYRRWVLQEPEFEVMPAHDSRSTRNSGGVRQAANHRPAYPGTPTFASHSNRDQALKAKAPLVLRRSTDNKLVRLVCNDCGKSDSSSHQGFLNHCRIKHKVDYKSHDAAAIDCGHVLSEEEVANLPAETQNTPAPKASVSRAPPAPATVQPSNLVHHFNTATGADVAVSKPKKTQAKRKAVPKLSSVSSTPSQSPLTPAAGLPRLSAHFAKYNVGVDLATAALNARQKVDLSIDDPLPSPDASELDSPLEHASSSRKNPAPGRAGMTVPSSMGRPPSLKGYRPPTQQRPRPSQLGTSVGCFKQESSEISESPHDASPVLSPHTADSNPGLVSDHEDDDHGSASEEEAPQAEMRRPITVPPTCADNMEIDVAVDDDMVEDGLIIRRGSMFADEQSGLHGAGSPSRKLGMGKRG